MEFEQLQGIDNQVFPLMKQFSGTSASALYYMGNGDHSITFTAGDPNGIAEGIAELFARLIININKTDVDGAFDWLRERAMDYYRKVMAEEARGDVSDQHDA